MHEARCTNDKSDMRQKMRPYKKRLIHQQLQEKTNGDEENEGEAERNWLKTSEEKEESSFGCVKPSRKQFRHQDIPVFKPDSVATSFLLKSKELPSINKKTDSKENITKSIVMKLGGQLQSDNFNQSAVTNFDKHPETGMHPLPAIVPETPPVRRKSYDYSTQIRSLRDSRDTTALNSRGFKKQCQIIKARRQTVAGTEHIQQNREESESEENKHTEIHSEPSPVVEQPKPRSNSLTESPMNLTSTYKEPNENQYVPTSENKPIPPQSYATSHRHLLIPEYPRTFHDQQLNMNNNNLLLNLNASDFEGFSSGEQLLTPSIRSMGIYLNTKFNIEILQIISNLYQKISSILRDDRISQKSKQNAEKCLNETFAYVAQKLPMLGFAENSLKDALLDANFFNRPEVQAKLMAHVFSKNKQIFPDRIPEGIGPFVFRAPTEIVTNPLLVPAPNAFPNDSFRSNIVPVNQANIEFNKYLPTNNRANLSPHSMNSENVLRNMILSQPVPIDLGVTSERYMNSSEINPPLLEIQRMQTSHLRQNHVSIPQISPHLNKHHLIPPKSNFHHRHPSENNSPKTQHYSVHNKHTLLSKRQKHLTVDSRHTDTLNGTFLKNLSQDSPEMFHNQIQSPRQFTETRNFIHKYNPSRKPNQFETQTSQDPVYSNRHAVVEDNVQSGTTTTGDSYVRSSPTGRLHQMQTNAPHPQPVISSASDIPANFFPSSIQFQQIRPSIPYDSSRTAIRPSDTILPKPNLIETNQFNRMQKSSTITSSASTLQDRHFLKQDHVLQANQQSPFDQAPSDPYRITNNPFILEDRNIVQANHMQGSLQLQTEPYKITNRGAILHDRHYLKSHLAKKENGIRRFNHLQSKQQTILNGATPLEGGFKLDLNTKDNDLRANHLERIQFNQIPSEPYKTTTTSSSVDRHYLRPDEKGKGVQAHPIEGHQFNHMQSKTYPLNNKVPTREDRRIFKPDLIIKDDALQINHIDRSNYNRVPSEPYTITNRSMPADMSVNVSPAQIKQIEASLFNRATSEAITSSTTASQNRSISKPDLIVKDNSMQVTKETVVDQSSSKPENEKVEDGEFKSILTGLLQKYQSKMPMNKLKMHLLDEYMKMKRDPLAAGESIEIEGSETIEIDDSDSDEKLVSTQISSINKLKRKSSEDSPKGIDLVSSTSEHEKPPTPPKKKLHSPDHNDNYPVFVSETSQSPIGAQELVIKRLTPPVKMGQSSPKTIYSPQIEPISPVSNDRMFTFPEKPVSNNGPRASVVPIEVLKGQQDVVQIEQKPVTSANPTRPASTGKKVAPNGKLGYDKDTHSFVRYYDDTQMVLFMRNLNIKTTDKLPPVRRTEDIIKIPKNVVFSDKEAICDPEEYVLETELVQKNVPEDFASFYLFVTGYQIVRNNNPISLHTFLTMYNTNRLESLLKKYLGVS